MIEIYDQERVDGVADALKAGNSVAFHCDITTDQRIERDPTEIMQSFAFVGVEEERQKDLFYFDMIMVSAGWNKNDDVFSPQELWKAKATPIHKQLNLMHDHTDIIGHMTASAVVDQDGNVVSADISEEAIPDKIDIVTSAVIYKTWQDKDQRERVQELCDEIDKGEWSVSMECMFPNFDYALVGPDSEHHVLERNPTTAFLTKHLRAYGGDGEYQGYKVGRLFRDLYFSGTGVVAKPANPRSRVLLAGETDTFSTRVNHNSIHSIAMEQLEMSDNSKEIQDLQEALASMKAEVADLKKTNEETIEEKNTAIAGLTEKVEALEKEVAEAEDYKKASEHKMKKKDEELEKMKEENSGLKKASKAMKRKAALQKAGASEEEAEETVEKFSEASDEMFEQVVALIDDRSKSESTEETEEAEAESDSDESEEADETELDEVEEEEESSEASVNTDEEEPAPAYASMAAWLRGNVLKTTKSLENE